MLSSDDACVTLDKLPEDVLSRVGNALVDDLCGGATALTQLSRTSHTLQRLFGGSGIQAVAMERGICGPTSLEGLAVLESVVGLGTNRIFFREAEAVFRAGSSRLRLEEFAAMLRRHPTLMALVEAHAGSKYTNQAMADNCSRERALAVGAALCRWQDSNWDEAQAQRFAHRLRFRHWGSVCATAAGWTAGLESCHAEVFFSLDGGTSWLPSKPSHYGYVDSSLAPEIYELSASSLGLGGHGASPSAAGTASHTDATRM